MTVIISFICVFALFVFVGCFFFSMLMFSGDGTDHPIKDGFKFLGFSFAGLYNVVVMCSERCRDAVLVRIEGFPGG